MHVLQLEFSNADDIMHRSLRMLLVLPSGKILQELDEVTMRGDITESKSWKETEETITWAHSYGGD